MALNGTLSDLGIVDLIQFPGKGRRTGELVIAGVDSEGRLYYADGALHHVEVGELAGIEALVDLVSWEEGEFEFRTGVVKQRRTVEMDLHRALMLALKIRDERAESSRRANGQTAADEPRAASGLLRDMILSSPNLQGICIFSEDGVLLAEAVSEDEDKGRMSSLRESMIALYKGYMRPGLTRTYLEDERSIVHGMRLAKGSVAFLAATRETSMGALSVTMKQLVSAMKEMH